MSKLADNIPLIEILATANVALSFYYDTAKIFTVTVTKVLVDQSFLGAPPLQIDSFLQGSQKQIHWSKS